MNVFVVVTEAGSLSAAARRLREPLTTVSRILSQLESHVACTLINRTTRRMMLTDAGRDYLKTCRQVLEELADAESRIAGQSTELSGELAITAPVSFGRLHALPMIAEFLGAYPRINARLLLIDRVVDLMEEGIDIAIRIGELADSGLVAMRVGTLKLSVCASPDYLAQHGIPTALTELSERDCVTFDGMPGGSRWVFKSKRYGRKAVKARSRLSVNGAEAAVEAAVAGIGITRVLSYQARSALDAGLLKPILERFEDTAIPIHLVYRPTRSNNPRVREFVEFAARRLRAEGALR